MKKLLLLLFFMAVVLCFQSCAPGYVSTVPTYNQGYRPAQPSNSHIWIGGNWSYGRRSRAYTQQNGHWGLPRRGRTYQEGSWNSNPRGNYWKRGQWR